MLTVNTTVGVLTGSNGFMVKSSTIEAHGGPSNGQGGFNPQISCNGTFAFFLEAFDMRTMQSVQGVSVQGVRAVRHVISGKVLDSTFITGVTTNTTDSSGSATYNVTFNTSKSFMPGPYDMILNVSYQGTEDEAFSGFMCGSGSFELFKPEGFRPPGGEGAGPQQGGREFQGGITGFPFGMPPRSGATDTVRLSFQGLGFGGQGFQGGQQGNPGASLINGTLKVTSIRYSNRDTNTERSIAATGNLVYNVTTSAAAVTLEPANFSLLSWPQGFMRLMVNLTNGSTPGIGTQPSALGQLPGFESSPYRVDFAEMPALPESVAVGQNVSILVNASTNVSTSGNNVTIRAQSMTSNTQVRTTLVSAVKVLDGWNSSADEIGFSPGAETWNVTFTVPTMDVGQINFVVVVNNSRSVTNELMARTRISSLEVRPLSGYIMQMHARCAVRDDATENGTMFNCFPLTMGGGPGQPFDPAEPSITSRLNFSVINTTYNVSSKSGNLCYKPALNYSGGMQGISFDNPFSLTNTTYVAVIDNLTAGVYDTLVFNNSGGNFTVMTLSNTSSSHRGFARFNSSYSGLYVTMLEGCFAVKLAKGDENPMDEQGIIRLGRNAVNQNFYLAYRVFNGGQKVTNAYVDLMGVGNMSLDGTQFVNLLPASQYRTRGSYSDNNGVAFVQANVSTAGERMLLWKVNGTANGQFVQAFAKIQRDPTAYGGGGGNMVTIASFNAFCNGFNPQITQANQNLSLTCQTMYLNDSNMGGVNITMFAESWGVRTALTMYNATTGAIQSGFLTDAMGSVQFNYTMPGGWLPNRFYRLSGLAVLGDLNQQFDTGGVSFGGGSGQWGGPMGQGGP
ncbi:hypothetical protein HYV43_06485 [Candidatus Micrarchaeota archaeon]|nr:hypothetical protein [Candidatus Micrarchaeota archaeon]